MQMMSLGLSDKERTALLVSGASHPYRDRRKMIFQSYLMFGLS